VRELTEIACPTRKRQVRQLIAAAKSYRDYVVNFEFAIGNRLGSPAILATLPGAS
jgi:hypothetical protein